METNEVKRVVYLRGLTKVVGTVSDYEYHVDDDIDVEIRVRESDMPNDIPSVSNLSIVNTARSNASVTVYCDKRTIVDVHSSYYLRLVRVCRHDLTIWAKSVSNMVLGRSIYKTICRELIVMLNNGRRDIRIEDSFISYASSANKVIIYGSVIRNVNILNMEIHESNIKYIDSDYVLCSFTYKGKEFMVTEEEFFVNGAEYSIEYYKDTSIYKEILPIINLLIGRKESLSDYDAEVLNRLSFNEAE